MDGYKKVVFIGMLGFCANLFLFVLKITIGIASNSCAMIADAMNSGSDILNSTMMLMGGRISRKPPCGRYPLGYGRAEYIFSLFISITMIIVSVFIFKGSFASLFAGEHMEFSYYIVFCCMINIAVKFALYRYARSVGKKYGNILIEVSSRDHRNDIFLAMSTLAGGICGYMGIWFVDGIVGICIALWIFFTGLALIKKSCAALMDCDDNDGMREEIIKKAETVNGVKRIESVIILNTYGNAEVRIGLYADPGMTLAEYTRLEDKIRSEICRDEGIGRVLFRINTV
ncbi:MAG: cation transporter [Oscillospiraceae bacterium]|nr:cation transporter [Oscillospiraceae bacterium]